jgi:hypothetical protein
MHSKPSAEENRIKHQNNWEIISLSKNNTKILIKEPNCKKECYDSHRDGTTCFGP